MKKSYISKGFDVKNIPSVYFHLFCTFYLGVELISCLSFAEIVHLRVNNLVIGSRKIFVGIFCGRWNVRKSNKVVISGFLAETHIFVNSSVRPFIKTLETFRFFIRFVKQILYCFSERNRCPVQYYFCFNFGKDSQ